LILLLFALINKKLYLLQKRLFYGDFFLVLSVSLVTPVCGLVADRVAFYILVVFCFKK